MKQEQQEQNGQPSEDELDIEIAAGMGGKMLSSEKAIQTIASAFDGPNAVRTIALFLAEMIGRIQESSMTTDIPINPAIWFMDGGPIDEWGDEISDIAQHAGVDFDKALMDEIKAETLKIAQQRAAEEEGQEGDGQPEEAEQPQRQGFLGGAV